MSVNPTSVLLLTLAVWVVTFLISLNKLRKLQLRRRTFIEFMLIVSALALFRMTIFLFLQYRTISHTFTDNVYNLSYLLYPETPLVSLIPISKYFIFIFVSCLSLLLGSYVWAFPILAIMATKRSSKRN